MSEIIASTYEIIERIGSGGAGVVYLANHLRLNKKVVLKADKRMLTTRPEALRREVDVLKNLSHTNIPQVYDFFVEGETVFTVMDYVEGENLDMPLKRGEKFSQPQAIKWGRQLLTALSYLHSPIHGTPPHGFVHSDIKPANLMRTPQNDVCLIDFNIALALGEENIVGRSEGYASPEHYGLDFSTNGETATEAEQTEVMGILTDTSPMSGNSDTIPMGSMTPGSSSKKLVTPDTRSDIYSVGATLYHLLTGKRPPKNAVEVEQLSDKEFSPQIVDIITKAMNPNPDLRFQSADEMLYAFEHLRENDIRTKRHRQNRYVAGILLAVLFTIGVSSSFIGLKRMEITNSILAYAEYSQSALAAGDPVTAVNYALQALPNGRGILTPPYLPQAQKALADSLGVYNLSDSYKPYLVVELPSEPFKTAMSSNGEIGAAVYAFAVAVFNTESGEVFATLPTVRSALADIEFVNDKMLVFAGEKGVSVFDIMERKIMWTGKLATEITVSSDGQTIAAVYRDESFATLYNISGSELCTVDFRGNRQIVIDNDIFANPNDNLLALNHNGSWLAVSFYNGALTIFNPLDGDNNIELFEESDYYHFEGGFHDNFFAFSSTAVSGESVFAIINLSEIVQEGGFNSTKKFGVIADENGIFLSNNDIIVRINPITGEQTELAYTNTDVRTFSQCSNGTAAATVTNDYVFFDHKARLISEYNSGYTSCDFINIAGDYALAAGRDTPKIRILAQKLYDQTETFHYDEFIHDETRINEDGTRIMMFDYRYFRLYDIKGGLICDTAIPDVDKVIDQQHSKKSGNLMVIYKNALRIYSGDNGELLLEKTGLKSAFYAPYGVSIFEHDGTVSLIDIDSAEIIESEKTQGEFAAFCGMLVNETFLNGGELIGAAKGANDYSFAIRNGTICAVYNGHGDKKFEAPVTDQTEAFFTDNAIILSPLHGTPVVYNPETGVKTAELEKDTYLTYVKEIPGFVLTEYVSADGKKYGILLDPATYLPLARLSQFTDITSSGELLFDYNTGTMRKSRIYTIEELINLAERG